MEVVDPYERAPHPVLPQCPTTLRDGLRPCRAGGAGGSTPAPYPPRARTAHGNDAGPSVGVRRDPGEGEAGGRLDREILAPVLLVAACVVHDDPGRAAH